MKKLLAFAISMCALSSFASEVAVGYGAMEEFTRVHVSYTTDPIYKNGGFEIAPEFGVAKYTGWNDSLTQIYITPKFIYRFSNGLSVDGGVGPGWISQKKLGDGKPFRRKFGSSFEFSSHVGVGYKVTDSIGVGYRLTHFSNAGTKKPNPGLDMHQIIVSYTY